MNNRSNTFRTRNETLCLVNILNTMYNDNLRQINNLTETLNNLNSSNIQIRNFLIELLNRNNNRNDVNMRNENSRVRSYLDNMEYDILRNTNGNSNNNGRNIHYLISEYGLPRSVANLNNRNGLVDAYTYQTIEQFLQPIDIYPTQFQIESATRRARYCDIARPINTSCPISMDEFSDTDVVTVIRNCGHIFHTDQIINWFRSHTCCPVCRYDIREYNSNATNPFLNNIGDSSNNTINSVNNNGNTLLHGEDLNEFITNSLESLEGLSSTGSSGNNSTRPIETLSSFLINILNRNQNAR
jgi:hypothetical protein